MFDLAAITYSFKTIAKFLLTLIKSKMAIYNALYNALLLPFAISSLFIARFSLPFTVFVYTINDFGCTCALSDNRKILLLLFFVECFCIGTGHKLSLIHI